MKYKLAIAFLSLTASMHAATLSFSTSTVFASGFDSASTPGTEAGSRMLWGVVVDTGGNGVSGEYRATGVNYTAGSYQLTTAAGTLSDDVLVIGASGNLMSLTTAVNDGNTPIGTNRISSIVVNFATVGTATIAANQAFSIIWFDRTATGGAAAGGDVFGLYTVQAAIPTLTNSLILPATNSASPGYSALFAGNDAIKTQNFSFVPEPSTALLGMLGALGLLRRRR